MGLRGKTVAITRPASQSRQLREGLEALGAEVVVCPAIEIVPVDDWRIVVAAIAGLDSYDWLLLTSVNAADLFLQRLERKAVVCRVPIVVVGDATAERVPP